MLTFNVWCSFFLTFQIKPHLVPLNCVFIKYIISQCKQSYVLFYFRFNSNRTSVIKRIIWSIAVHWTIANTYHDSLLVVVYFLPSFIHFFRHYFKTDCVESIGCSQARNDLMCKNAVNYTYFLTRQWQCDECFSKDNQIELTRLSMSNHYLFNIHACGVCVLILNNACLRTILMTLDVPLTVSTWNIN